MHTSYTDFHGLTQSGANAAAIDAYDQALADFRCLRGDPLAHAEAAIAAAPSMPMAQILKAWLLLTSTETAALAPAQAALQAARALPMNAHERGHHAAAEALAAGRWQRAGLLLEDLAAAAPNDLLALQVGHQVDFFRGDSRMLRDRIARALPRWKLGTPGRHAVLGMLAFGHEEMGDYAAAERCGREAVELEPLDGWAWHAVAHVHEMRGETRHGIAWLRGGREHWSAQSFFAPHNSWHLALFHLAEGDSRSALALYDEVFGNQDSSVALELIDASAMLARLQLLGIDPGAERWQALSARWSANGAGGSYAFNDVHALIAHLGAGRLDAAAAMREALRRAEAIDNDNAGFSRDVGAPLADALLAVQRQRPGEAVAILRQIRHRAARFGGSHAQRDLLDLLLLDAVAATGNAALLAALVAERRVVRGGQPLLPLSVHRQQHAVAA